MSDPKISEQAAAKAPRGKTLYDNAIASLRILMSPNVTVDNIPARGDKPARTVRKQNMIVIGGPIQHISTYSAWEPEDVLDGGVYVLGASCLIPGEYGSWTISKYDAEYIRIGDLTKDQEELFKPQQTDINDFT